MAAPLAFPPEVRRVRPQDKRDRHGDGRGQSPEPGSSLEAAAGGKEEPRSSWIYQQDPREPIRKPSPHPVKPMRSTPAPESPHKEEPFQACSLSPVKVAGQERLVPKSAIGGSSAASVVQLEKTEPKQGPPAKYHHLTREELLQLLLRREAELGKKEQQVQELESYIDRLLVRIMEQSPTLLQIPLGEGAKATQ